MKVRAKSSKRGKTRDPNYKARYAARKQAGLCVRCGCPAVAGALLCDDHQRVHRDRNRIDMQKRRSQWRAEGRCITCGADAPRGVHCSSCYPRRHTIVVDVALDAGDVVVSIEGQSAEVVVRINGDSDER